MNLADIILVLVIPAVCVFAVWFAFYRFSRQDKLKQPQLHYVQCPDCGDYFVSDKPSDWSKLKDHQCQERDIGTIHYPRD